eukprot:168826_1
MWANIVNGKQNTNNSSPRKLKVQHVQKPQKKNTAPNVKSKSKPKPKIKKRIRRKRTCDKIKNSMKQIQQLLSQMTIKKTLDIKNIASMPVNMEETTSIEYMDKLFCKLKDKNSVESNDFLPDIYKVMNILKCTSIKQHILSIKCLKVLCNAYIWRKYCKMDEFVFNILSVFHLIASRNIPKYSSMISSAIRIFIFPGTDRYCHLSDFNDWV